jgi:hypothetical protein
MVRFAACFAIAGVVGFAIPVECRAGAGATKPATTRPAEGSAGMTRPGREARGGATRFTDAGIRGPERVWRSWDYERAGEVLSAGKVGLPLLSEAAGRALFERIVSVENFTIHRDGALPIEARIQDYLTISRQVNVLLRLYNAESRRGGDVHREVCRLLAFTLKMNGVGIGLMDDYAAALPHDDDYAARVEDLEGRRRAAGRVFGQVEGLLADRESLTAEDRSVLLEGMESSLPTLKAFFAPEYRVRLGRALESHLAALDRDEDAGRVRRMQAELAR